MADRMFLVDLDLSGNEIKRARIENLSANPTGDDLYEGRLWFNTTTKRLCTYADGQVRSMPWTGEGGGGGGAPDPHAASHATGSSDPITPLSIGAAPALSPIPTAGNYLTSDGAGGFGDSGFDNAAFEAALAAKADRYRTVSATHTSATLTLQASDAMKMRPLSAAANPIAVTIPHTLWEVGGGGRGFSCEHVITSVAGGAVTFAGSGGIVVTYHGSDPSEVPLAAGDLVRILVLSATSARVEIIPAWGGNVALAAGITADPSGYLTADSVEALSAIYGVTGYFSGDLNVTGDVYATEVWADVLYAAGVSGWVGNLSVGPLVADAYAPTVQAAHTSATKTLAAGDANDVIPTNGASNAIAVTVPHTLYAAAGTGRAFQCEVRPTSVAGGALTFVGSGGIVLEYHGKDPAVTPFAAGDLVRVLVVSATLALIITQPVGGSLAQPGGTTTSGGIVTGSGVAGAAVAISTTTIADLVKRLGNVHLLSANTVLDDSYSGGIIFTDTSGGARTHTIPPTVGAGWNAVFVREGANTLNIVGSTVGADTMLMKGPAAVANAVAITVDDGGVSVIRRSATKCWCAGKIS